MARQAALSVAAVLVLAALVCSAHVQDAPKVEAAGKVFNGAKAVDSSNEAKVLSELTSRIGSAVSGLKIKLEPALKAAGGIKADVLTALLEPLQATAETVLNSVSAVREAAQVSLNSFFGLLLDNTRELRSTLEDGNAVIDIVRTLRGAKCAEAVFEPPKLKPATLKGPAGKLEITTGACTLTRKADVLELDYTLQCTEPGVAFSALIPRYTSRFVSAATATTEECKVARNYGMESETVITLFNVADFLAASGGSEEASSDNDESGADGPLRRRLGVNAAAGWFNKLFPLSGVEAKEGEGASVTFLPAGVREAVDKAIQQSLTDFSVEYKPFTIRNDLIQQASNVAEALGQTFEVRDRVFKVYKDDLKEWATGDKKEELLKEINFSGNLREAMAKYNVTNLFDGMFAKTASRLMSKSGLGSKLPGGELLTEKPLRTLLSKARQGVGKPVGLKVEAGLESAVSQAVDALRKGAAGGDWADLLPKVPRKGSLMERLLKNKGVAGHMEELQKVLDGMGDLTAQLLGAAGGLRQAQPTEAAPAADADADAAADAAGKVEEGSQAAAGPADAAPAPAPAPAAQP